MQIDAANHAAMGWRAPASGYALAVESAGTGLDPLSRPVCRWLVPPVFGIVYGLFSAFLAASGVGMADHRSGAATSTSTSALLAGLIAGALVTICATWLMDPLGPQWRLPSPDRRRIVAVLAGAPARERWLAELILRTALRRRKAGVVLALATVASVVGTLIGIETGGGELTPLFAFGGLFGAALGSAHHGGRLRPLIEALRAAGIAPASSGKARPVV